MNKENFGDDKRKASKETSTHRLSNKDIDRNGLEEVFANIGEVAKLRRNLEKTHYMARTEILPFYLPTPGFLDVGSADDTSPNYFLGYLFAKSNGRIFEKKDLYRRMDEQEHQKWQGRVHDGTLSDEEFRDLHKLPGLFSNKSAKVIESASLAQSMTLMRFQVEKYWEGLRALDSERATALTRNEFVRGNVLSIAIMEKVIKEIYKDRVGEIVQRMSQKGVTVCRVDESRTLVICKSKQPIYSGGEKDVISPKLIVMSQENYQALQKKVTDGDLQAMLTENELKLWLQQNLPARG